MMINNRKAQSRLEFKALNGVSSLLDLLTAEYTEITENALLCLLKMADDCMLLFVYCYV
jgi:hypothetical protein